MLTNNKNFVRSIAMLLAVLMVMALCLTGCGNKAADEALTKAEEAKTAADAVTAALDGYVAKDDKATVKALVIEALGDDYATAAELEALAAKLADYVTAENVEKMIKDEMAKYALDKLSGELMTKEAVLEILKDYYTKKEIDDKFADILGEFTAEQVQTILKDAMTLPEWDKTSAIVLETIENLQTLLKSLGEYTYTQANMAKINECLAPFGIEAFDYDKDAKVYIPMRGNAEKVKSVSKLLEYAILRQATTKDMEALKAVVDTAVAVPTFETSFAALKADLFALGDLYEVGKYKANGQWDTNFAKYGADSFYHEVAYAKGDLRKVQIVTLADKAGFHEFAKKYDALLAEYYADKAAYKDVADAADKALYESMAEGTGEGWQSNQKAYDLYEVASTSGVALVTYEVGTDYTAPANSRKLGMTVLKAAEHNDFLTKAYQKMKANELIAHPLLDITTTGLVKNDPSILTTQFKKTGSFVKFWTDLGSGDHTPNRGIWTTAYALVYNQLLDVQNLANTANDTFKNFLNVTVKGNTVALGTKTFETITDAEFLAALVAGMCEEIADKNNNVAIAAPYLLDDVDPAVKNFMVANGQAYDATVGGFVKWSLYEDMMKKSFDLLWDKYKTQATDWADSILKDYIAVTYEAANNAAAKDDAATTDEDERNVNVVGLSGNVGAELAADASFVEAFVNGTPLTGEIYTALQLNDKFEESYLNKFYLNNGQATTINTKVNDTAIKTGALVYAVPMASIYANAENIRQRLTGSMTYTELAIARADMATLKNSGVSVREAFYDMLLEGIENLDEIYARFLFEDYKKMTYNNTVVNAEKIITFYNHNAANAAQVEKVERYLMGIATIGTPSTANVETGIKFEWSYKTVNGASVKDKITKITYKANDLEGTLSNGYLVAQIAPISANLWATSNGSGTEKDAEAKMKQVDEIVAEVIATIENMIIKANFLSYLDEARYNLLMAYGAHETYLKNTINASDWATSIKLIELNNSADAQITVTQFYYNRGDYKLADYKEAYVENVLKLITSKYLQDGQTINQHAALLSGKGIVEIVNGDTDGLATDAFNKALKNVKSSTNKNWVAPAGAYSPYFNRADTSLYMYVGTYAVELDKILNTIDGIATLYTDDAGNRVPLY